MPGAKLAPVAHPTPAERVWFTPLVMRGEKNDGHAKTPPSQGCFWARKAA